jgi:hypothetical protein
VSAEVLECIWAALRGVPRLPGAACRGLYAVMDDVDMPDDALKICAGCSALQACDAWAQSQPENALNGVVGGRVYAWVLHPGLRRKATA